jgi:uncharacterized membrane protein YedE/YeeE
MSASVVATAFTPATALIGGAMIGLASTWLMAALGRVAGISGIFNSAVDGPERGWRLAFLIALIVGAGAWFAYSGTGGHNDSPLGVLIAAGVLVGAGTRWGNGCTSGHGICGLARLSRRSLVAVLVFMATAFVTTYVMRHVLAGAG